MTKMAATLIYGKNLSKPPEPVDQFQQNSAIIICSNDDPGLTLTYFWQGQISQPIHLF